VDTGPARGLLCLGVSKYYTKKEGVMRLQILEGVIVCLLAVSLMGCGALLQGSHQTINIQSSPSGAKVTVSPTGEEYTTPTSIRLERKNTYVLTFTKEGYAPAKFTIQKKLDVGMVILDFLFTGLVGVVVDAVTGAWYDLMPEVVTVTLERMRGAIDKPKEILVHMRLEGNTLRIESDEPGVKVRVEAIR
jgi:hypothetical protein